MAIYFWKPTQDNGYLSNWYPSPFRVASVDMIFSNAEQFMMYCKAKLFKDEMMAKKIMETDNPNEIRSLGRLVTNFDPVKWEEKCDQVVTQACYLKFSQNKELKEKLLATGDKLLVEASPYDKKWGIGLSKYNAIKTKKENWPGENRLGKCLMNVREKLK